MKKNQDQFYEDLLTLFEGTEKFGFQGIPPRLRTTRTRDYRLLEMHSNCRYGGQGVPTPLGLSFADGLKGVKPYAELPEGKANEGISGLELSKPLRDGPANGRWRERRKSQGFRPALMRRNLPANCRSHSGNGEADHRRAGPPAQGVSRVDPRGVGPDCRHWAGYASET